MVAHPEKGVVMPNIRCSPLFAAAFLLAASACTEDSESPAGPEPTASLATATAASLTFEQVTTGGSHSCGLTPEGRVYCWGLNRNGQLGDNTTTDRSRPIRVVGGLIFTTVNA